MKHGIEILAAILSASAMLFSGCGKAEVTDSTEVNSLKKSIISTIEKQIEKTDGQIASFGDELVSMRDSDKYQEEDIRILEEKLSALSKELSDIEDSVSRLEDSGSDFTETVDEVNSRLESLDAEIEALRAMIVKLKEDAADAGGGDVEKIIYVPKYEDRPDSLHYHLDGLKILGDITLRFATQPQEAAVLIAEHWETALSAHAIYDGDEFDLTITGTSVNDSGTLAISISAENLPRNFIEGSGCVGVKVLYGEEPVSSSIRVGAVVDEPVVLTMLSQFDIDGDGQVVDDLNEMTVFRMSEYQELSPYFNLLLAAMPALTSLNCSKMDLTTLDLSNNPALTTLNCYNNSSLTTLDLSNNPALTTLYCDYNGLTTLDLSNNPALTTLSCNDNGLTTLDLSNNPALTTLRCINNGLTTLDLSNNPALTALYCSRNGLTTLDLSNNPALTALDCSRNGLTTLDLSNAPALTTLECDSNGLTTLDLSNAPALTTLECDSNSLTTLDLSNNPALTTLRCSDNGLTTLDLSNAPALTSLNCSGNSLTALDISKNPALTSLSCFSNSLTALDISKNPALTSLNCSGNNLTALDISKNPALTSLICSINSLTALDISKNPALTSLVCNNNNLTALDVSKNTSLASLYVSETVKLIVSTELKSSIYNAGQYVSIDGVAGIVYDKTSSPAIVSIDEISDTWDNGRTWCTSKGSAWSMPSLDELKLMYENRETLNRTLSSIGATQFSSDYKVSISGHVQLNWYWSSTEDYSNNAYSFEFVFGSSDNISKSNLYGVRAVRAL